VSSWRRVHESTLSALHERTGEILHAAPDHQMEHDLVWLRGLVSIPSQSLAVFVLHRGEEVVGYAPFVVHPSALAYELGGTALARRQVSRYVLAGEPVFDGALAGASPEVLVDLFRTLRPQLKPRHVVFLAGVSADSTLFGLVHRRSPLHKLFHVVPHGPSYQRRRIRLGGSYDEYLRSLRGTTRRGLKRSRRKFLTRAGEDFTLRRFEAPDDVAPFLHHATEVSRKTYQGHLLGQGMRDVASRNAKYTYAAKNGWFRSYLLYAGGQQIAFASGYLHNKSYYGHELGCDPDWRPSHAGVFLLTEIIQDLFADTVPVEIYDFLYGDDLLKSRLANTERTERHFYLFPRSFHGACMAYPLRAVNALSSAASYVLQRLRLKEYVRRLRRDRAVRRKHAG
jgi:hypothetical protein